jgi:hypothetical protein
VTRLMQGYNAQAATNTKHIVIGAEVNADSPDFGHLRPMLDAAQRELRSIGFDQVPEVVLADAGHWHQDQMENIINRGIQVLIPPDAAKRKTPRPGWDGGLYSFIRRVLDTDRGGELYAKRQGMIEPRLRPHQVQPPLRPLPQTRTLRRPQRMATDHRHPQPPQALAAHHRPGHRLTAPNGRPVDSAAHPSPPARASRFYATASMGSDSCRCQHWATLLRQARDPGCRPRASVRGLGSRPVPRQHRVGPGPAA